MPLTSCSSSITGKSTKPTVKAIDVELAVQKELRQLSNQWGAVRAIEDPKLDDDQDIRDADIRAIYNSNGKQYLLCCHTRIAQVVYVYRPDPESPLMGSILDIYKREIGHFWYIWEDQKLKPYMKRSEMEETPPLFDAAVLDELYPIAAQFREVVARTSGTPGKRDD